LPIFLGANKTKTPRRSLDRGAFVGAELPDVQDDPNWFRPEWMFHDDDETGLRLVLGGLDRDLGSDPDDAVDEGKLHDALFPRLAVHGEVGPSLMLSGEGFLHLEDLGLEAVVDERGPAALRLHAVCFVGDDDHAAEDDEREEEEAEDDAGDYPQVPLGPSRLSVAETVKLDCFSGTKIHVIPVFLCWKLQPLPHGLFLLSMRLAE